MLYLRKPQPSTPFIPLKPLCFSISEPTCLIATRSPQALSRPDSTLKLTEFSYRNCASRPESGLCIQRRLKRGKIVLRIIANYFSLDRPIDRSSLRDRIESRWLKRAERERERESTFSSFSFVLPEVRWIESFEIIFLPSKSRLEIVFISKTAVKSRRFSRDSIEPKRLTFYLLTVKLTQSLTCNWATRAAGYRDKSVYTFCITSYASMGEFRITEELEEFYFIP